jgi:hypothetical protein
MPVSSNQARRIDRDQCGLKNRNASTGNPDLMST